jgi:ABC-type Zn uptake system ZnuABC Zn-binding protein ZnuA
MRHFIVLFLFLIPFLASCGPAAPADTIHVIAVESFLADLAQDVAGDRIEVDSLIPPGVDPHGFELTPADLVKLTEADMIILNGHGLESWLTETMDQTNHSALIIQASDGLEPRLSDGNEPDPHFWLDPTLVVTYIENIRLGLTKIDPQGEAVFSANAQKASRELNELDQWIAAQTGQIPEERRLLITNHETFGYYAERYGFQVVGAIIPSITTGSSPTAKEVAALVDQIEKTHAPALFLEIESNPQIANQIANETGVKVVDDLYTHSLSEKGGPAADYFSMMKWNTTRIVSALQ